MSIASAIAVREVDSVDALVEIEVLLARIWDTTADRPPVNVDILRALAHTGCYVAGAYEGERVVGASVGFLGVDREGEVHLHSHITGVAPEAQGRHIGLGLKEHQRSWCLDRGIEVVTWTFDPFVPRNAWFNLHRLGADVVELVPDFYGEMRDGINAGQASDRFVVRWNLPGAAPRPALVAVDGDVVVPVERSARQQLRRACGDGLRVVGLTDGAAYVLRP